MNCNEVIVVLNYGRASEIKTIDTYISEELKKKKILVLEYLFNKYSLNAYIEITKYNYCDLIPDIEIRCFFEQLFLSSDEKPDYNISFLFLMAFSKQGYNFGQFRLMSHLIKIGYKRENIKIFPLYISNNKYYYDENALKETLLEFKPTYICETAYIGWDKETCIINEKIKECCDTLIMIGGPFTTSHFSFCQEHINADIIFVGHGEYVFEAFLKACNRERNYMPNIDNIPGVFYSKGKYKLSNVIPIINHYMDFLNWDIELLSELYKIAPVINLFTSEECKGNCVFCYRVSSCINNTMSNYELLERITSIRKYDKFKESKKSIYIRFFDDDFFASKNRTPQFLRQLSHFLLEDFRLYELTFSIRSINKLQKEHGQEIYDAIKSLNLKRVTIGVDGFNDNDLKRLRKGYDMYTVYNNVQKLSNNNIPVLMYSILTTFETNKIELYQSLKNMISLSCLKDVYIGPTITPSIWVHSGNKKLFPKFREENVIYLNVETLDPTQNSSNCILSAQILPKDSFVRKFVEDIGQPSLMESAYIIPLMARFMKQLSFEANFFNKLLLDVSYKKRICKKLLRTIENYKERLRKICYSDVNSINMVHKYRREIEDSYEFISILSTNKIKQKYEEILNIFDDYNEFCSLQMQCEQLSGLSGNIYRLLELPIQVFLKNLDHEASLKHNVILEKVIDVTKEEYKMFERLLGI